MLEVSVRRGLKPSAAYLSYQQSAVLDVNMSTDDVLVVS